MSDNQIIESCKLMTQFRSPKKSLSQIMLNLILRSNHDDIGLIALRSALKRAHW
jgi:hypothetical protein